ncbi:MAG: tryptophan synthase subunit alpha [Acidobacteriota bacterium]
MRTLFFPYLLANYPDSSRFAEIFDLTAQYADTIEIGIPFSDPVADGPVIAAAASDVLAKGFSIDFLFRTLQKQNNGTPLAMMSYANPVLAYGRIHFMQASAACGAKYLIVPDVPFEESEEWRGIANENGLSWISFVSLLTKAERLNRITASAQGFIYLLSLKGITGAKIYDPEMIRMKAIEIKKQTKVPLALGFGIKSAQDTKNYSDIIDAFIVGSRIVEIIQSGRMDNLTSLYESFRRLS